MSSQDTKVIGYLIYQPEIGNFDGFHHIRFYVGNAKQAASYYTTRFGFSPIAFDGLETGNREFATHVVGNGRVVLAFSTALANVTVDQQDFHRRITEHGDGVKDFYLNIDNVEKAFDLAVSRGAKIIQGVTKIEDKSGLGYSIVCGLEVYKDTNVFLINNTNFKGTFLPNFKPLPEDPINLVFPKLKFNWFDHIANNHAVGDMQPTVEWFIKILDFHIFWSVDDKIIHTDYSGLKSTFVADYEEVIKFSQNEPANSKRGKSQIQEYVDYYNGSGVQHIAINVDNIIETIQTLKSRGLEFLKIPSSYYDGLRKRLKVSSVKLKEDIADIERLGILVDFDEEGYLLQLFTKTCEDRPTLFFEFIQRENNTGYGAGNFKSLFEAIERDQMLRGNLN